MLPLTLFYLIHTCIYHLYLEIILVIFWYAIMQYSVIHLTKCEIIKNWRQFKIANPKSMPIQSLLLQTQLQCDKQKALYKITCLEPHRFSFICPFLYFRLFPLSKPQPSSPVASSLHWSWNCFLYHLKHKCGYRHQTKPYNLRSNCFARFQYSGFLANAIHGFIVQPLIQNLWLSDRHERKPTAK